MSKSLPRVELSETFNPIGFPYFVGGDVNNLQTVNGWNYAALCASEPHHILPNGAWSGGGPFYVHKSSCSHYGAYVYPFVAPGFDLSCHLCGVVGCPTALPDSVNVASSVARMTADNTSIQAYYPTGYARTRPGNPVADVFQFIYELRDLPRIPFGGALLRRRRSAGGSYLRVPLQQVPRVLLEHLNSFKQLGNEYLNVVFGWKPFVNDLRKMYNLWQTIDKRMAQIIRENGHGIKRKATIKDDSDTTFTQADFGTCFVNVYGGAGPIGSTSYTVTTKVDTKVWFVAKYQYYIPDVGSSQWTARAKAVLFGALPTPDAVWSVLPWSWLIDWFGNTGDVISNLSPNAVDNLTTQYSFTMRHQKTVVNAQAVCSAPPQLGVFQAPEVNQTFLSIYQDETKQRVGGGNPFGIGVQLESLSGYQLGILAALGASKGLVR